MGMMLKELAAALGVSAATVTRNAQDGMPTDSVEAARAWRAENCRARIAAPRPGQAALLEGAAAAGPASIAPDAPADAVKVEDYYVSRARREAAEASRAELALAELQGELVRAADVRASLARRAAAFREGLLQIADRLAAVLAAETDQARVHELLSGEIRTTLLQLTEA